MGLRVTGLAGTSRDLAAAFFPFVVSGKGNCVPCVAGDPGVIPQQLANSKGTHAQSRKLQNFENLNR